jgi:hypothetical protein
MTADFTDNTDDQFVADIHTFTSQVKTAPLLSFCNDRHPCDLRNPRFFALRKLGLFGMNGVRAATACLRIHPAGERSLP